MRTRFRSFAIVMVAASMVAVLGGGRAGAQPMADSSTLSVGVFGGYQIVQHYASLAGLPDVPTCAPGFGNGDGSGSGFGALARLKVLNSIALELRLGFSSSTAKMSVQENIGNVVQNGEVVPAISEHLISTKFAGITVEPQVVWSPFPFPLGLHAGVELTNFATATFEQTETIVSPSNITFNGGLVRNRYKGDIPTASTVYFAAFAGVSYDIPVSRRVTMAPEVSYYGGLTKIIPDTNWSMNSFRVGLSFRVSLGGPDDTTGNPPTLIAKVEASKVDADSLGNAIPKMRVEEFVAPQLRPLLNYVFFDEDSATMPGRYVRLAPAQVRRFNLNSLQNFGVLPTYYHILNVIGYRMRQNNGATITLTGCNADEGDEHGKTDLSRQRAEGVRAYLHDVWGIEDSRVTVEARNLPEKPSTSSAEGREENRRVEIRASMPEILEPIFTVDTALTTDPNGVRFTTEVHSEAPVQSWKVWATQGGHELKTFSGTGDVPSTMDWDLQGERPSIPRGAQQVEYRIEVTDARNQHYVSPPKTIGVEQVTVKRKREQGMADREINRFSLILFEYGKSDISDANKRIVDFIKGRIAPNAKVQITGHTDRAGDASANQRLSEERARSVSKALGVPGAEVKGLGESILLYDNDLPEGRFYCRVVNVIVETTIGH